MAENEVPYEKDSNITYYYPPIIGTQIRDYSKEMKWGERKAFFQKTSERLAAVDEMFREDIGAFEKLRHAGEVCEWQQQIFKVMEKYAMAIEKKNLIEAEKIYNTEFMRLKHCDIKGAFSVGEIQNNLDSKSKFLQFYEKLKVASQTSAAIMGAVDKANKAIEYYQRIRILISTETDFSSQLTEAGKCRTEFMQSKAKMNALVGICGDLAKLAPSGMNEYIQFNLAVFKASDKAMKIIDKHGDKIENLLAEIEKKFKENNQSKTVTAGDVRGFDDKMIKGNLMIYNKHLDSTIGRPR